MGFKEWGEAEFIDHIAKQFPVKENILGIGDDSAVISEDNRRAWLVTTDALVEGIHFLKEQITAQDLGYKTVAVNVSDIAAMGGEPAYAFLSIALPKGTARSWALQVMEGVKEACHKWKILLLGGDTVGSKRDVFLNLTLIGSADRTKIKYRSHAHAGDLICVNRYLGDSGGGLKALQTATVKTKDIQRLIEAHFRPEPLPYQGSWLAAHPGVHAMIDISDGLECDLKRILKQSRKGAVIETALIPISSSLARVSEENNWDALELALVGGEDYCLLFTVAADAFDNLQCMFQNTFGCPLYVIGHINEEADQLSYIQHGKEISVNYSSYEGVSLVGL